jgi:hypothetical protein
LSSGATIGIIIGTVVGAMIFIALGYFFGMKKASSRPSTQIAYEALERDTN